MKNHVARQEIECSGHMSQTRKNRLAITGLVKFDLGLKNNQKLAIIIGDASIQVGISKIELQNLV